MNAPDSSTIHDIRVFAFDESLLLEEQASLIRQIASLMQRVAGLASQDYLLNRQAMKWIQHLAWRAGSQPIEAQGLSPSQAQAVLDRLKSEDAVEHFFRP